MAYYDALIAKWATLTPGTTAAKLAQINALTVTGTVPTSILFSGAELINCIAWAEFAALTAAQQQNIMLLCATGTSKGLLGGSANTALLPVGMIIAYFPPAGTTITNLTAMAKGLTQPWWQAPIANGGGGLTSPLTQPDLTAAGGLT